MKHFPFRHQYQTIQTTTYRRITTLRLGRAQMTATSVPLTRVVQRCSTCAKYRTYEYAA